MKELKVGELTCYYCFFRTFFDKCNGNVKCSIGDPSDGKNVIFK